MNIVCLGDSITHAANMPERDRWTSVLQRMLEAKWPGKFDVFNCGYGGDTTAQGIERMAGGVLPRMPGLVLVEFGFNDACCREWQARPRVGIAEFAANLKAISAMVRRKKGRVVYLLNHIPIGIVAKQGDGASYYRRVASYNGAIRKVARGVGAPVVDWPGHIKRKGLEGPDYLGDPVHLSAAGNRHYGECVFSALEAILSKPAGGA